VPQTLAFPQFVEWMNGRLADRREPLPPENPAIIGETLELLFSQDTGLGIGALIDPSYRRAKVLFLFDNRTEQGERTDTRREALFTAIENAMTTHMPDAEYVVSGGIAFARRSEVYLRESQVISILVFFGFLVALLLYLFRDLRWALAAILPTVSGIVVYYGISGWAAMPISFVAVFFVAGLMGVSNDDVLYLTLSIRRSRAYSVPRILETLARSGGAIVQTTVIIMIGVGTFAFSSYRPLGHGGFAFAASLATCSLVTLFVVPALLRWIVTDKRLHSEPRKRSPRAPRD
jgi:predicted RND superfamily exporter protein